MSLPYDRPSDPAKRHPAALTDGPDRAGARAMSDKGRPGRESRSALQAGSPVHRAGIATRVAELRRTLDRS